ncbi:hypothetical protein SAMN05216358_0052 [Rhizobium sp. AN5]|uniref:hypothetical protein n=1 Tax=Rhizobium sp. AN5 TaxID=1855304 RepID=UPI000BD26579|nr:hypothetical protein [Rhizobium sp. AN5]SOC90033.1 hypothetical protein SAMN05216358_0052 [Rhizobium sp. AN5]
MHKMVYQISYNNGIPTRPMTGTMDDLAYTLTQYGIDKDDALAAALALDLILQGHSSYSFPIDNVTIHARLPKP